MLSPRFPAAMRAVNALAPVHVRNPTGVVRVAEIMEAVLQAYGRCLLEKAIDGRPSDAAVRQAERHIILRGQLREAISALEVASCDASDASAITRCSREVDHLSHTIDTVLALRNVHCSHVASGLTS